MINQKSKVNTSMFIITASALSVFLYTFMISNIGYFTIDENIEYFSVFAQMNSPNGSSTTILGEITIPPNSNGTMTTAVNNANNNTNPTAINKTLVAQNVTAAVNILKENATFPISPTGISTQGLHQPPQHRLVNNTNST